MDQPVEVPEEQPPARWPVYALIVSLAIVGAFVGPMVMPEGTAWYEASFFGIAAGALGGMMTFPGRLLM